MTLSIMMIEQLTHCNDVEAVYAGGLSDVTPPH